MLLRPSLVRTKLTPVILLAIQPVRHGKILKSEFGMKKLLIISAAILAFAGCAKEAAQIETKIIDGKEYMTFKVVAHDDVVSADTKATLSRDGYFGWNDGEVIYFVDGSTVATGTYDAGDGSITVESGDWKAASNAPFDSDSKIQDFGLAKGPVVVAKVEGAILDFYHIGSIINIKFESIPIDGDLEFWSNNGEKWGGGNFQFDSNGVPALDGDSDDIFIKRPITVADSGKDISLTVPNIRYENGFTVALSGTSARYFVKTTANDYNLEYLPTLLNMKQLSMPTYTIAGNANEFFGSGWDVTDVNNNMVLDTDGLYRKSYVHTPASFEFKIVEDHAWGTEWPYGTDNYVYNVTNQTAGATIIFNRGNNSISVEEFDIYTVVGDTELCGTYWGDTWTETYVNDMEETTPGSGVFYKQLTGITAGTYSFKVVKNHSWDNTWGADGGNFIYTAPAGDVEIYFDINKPNNPISIVGYTPIYIVAGQPQEIFNNKYWDQTADENQMVLQPDGTYRISFAIPDTDDYDEEDDVWAGFKVTRDKSWDIAMPADNYWIKLIRNKTLNITYNVNTGVVSASVD